jgi:hypothetical protein
LCLKSIMEPIGNLYSKKLLIAEEIEHSQEVILSALNQLINADKRKNPFGKSYNRRPMAKKKNAAAIFCAAFSSFVAANRINVIIQQPAPKYQKGGD